MPEIDIMIQQKVRYKKTCFHDHFQYSYSKVMNNKGVYSTNKMRSLKSLIKLKCESRNSLHAVQYK